MFRSLVLGSVRLFNSLSLKVSQLFKSSYQLLIPFATYAPWCKDQDFMDAFNRVKKHSLVNMYQCWELWNLAAETEKAGGDVIEIGVYRGSSSALIGLKMKMNGSGDQLFCCDTFEGVVKASEHDGFYKGGEHKNTSVKSVEELLNKDFGIQNVTILKGIFPEETGHAVENHCFRLCHIDVDTYQSAREIAEWIWPRLNTGGVVVFNDFGYPRTQGITKLVEEHRERNDRLVLHNLNGNGIVIKIK